ncbi:MAG: hypothetical protein V3T02_07965 [Alphaproteobacteria bacterium]
MLVIYEIHTLRDGEWKIDSIFDDRDLALQEGHRIEHSNRYSAVRVIEETLDEATEKGSTRTIYRGTAIDRANRTPDRPRPKRAAQLAAELAQAAAGHVDTGPSRTILSQFLLIFFGFGALMLLGAGVMVTLHYFSM